MIEGKQSQLQQVLQILQLGSWVTLYSMASLIGASDAGISARVRDLRKSQHGGYNIIKRKISKSTWQYRLVNND